MGVKKKPGSLEKILFPTDFSRESALSADYERPQQRRINRFF